MPMTDKDREIAAGIRARAAEAFDRIRADRNLSDEGKRANLLSVHQAASKQLRAEHDRIRERDTKHKADLERRLFGLTPHALGADVISYRDALDRASRIQNADQANELLSMARGSGDKVLERAVFAHAYEMAGPSAAPWNELVTAYLQARPDLQADVDELSRVSHADSILDTQMQLRMQMPAELAGHVDASGQLKTPAPAA
ncbi:hypothetical protein SAMN03159343_0256 [Klenkia marina]|uniref:Uncharacterized protein n=1 Tax=Klenkia marina TaxID=1960309 RepID=A0A1G4X9W2_9ACTN|nr:hypothetical protein [Klenkia marina]SCX37977.1 hypothetical protein SAMN03159343_0256 [Klenkia marina]